MSKSLTTLAIEHDHLDGHSQISVCTGLEVASDDAAAWAEYGDPGKEDVDVALAYLRGSWAAWPRLLRTGWRPRRTTTAAGATSEQ
jgi:hypothetical protein